MVAFPTRRPVASPPLASLWRLGTGNRTKVCSMFDGRIYRAAFVPFLFVLVIVGFSLSGQAAPLDSTLAPDAFNGQRAFAGLQALVKRFPDRAPGSAGDNELAAYIAAQLRGLGNGFQVGTSQVQAATIEGTRTLTTVVAERPGSTGLSPIVIMAHRDAPAPDSAAQLSGTAALLGLARVFSESETRRTIVLVSTSGGSGGYAGAADFAQHETPAPDAAIVLGDLAGSVVHKPFVLPFSSKAQIAPEALQRTLDGAISQEVGTDSGAPGLASQLAHLALPLSTGEEAPLNSAGTPAVLVQVSGERGPSAREKVSANRLQNFGKAVLSSIYALDEAPNIAPSFAARVSLGHKLLAGWAVRLLVLALLLPPLLVGIDALARLRRRREPVRRWLVWTLTGALPFLASALFAIVLGALGIVAAPTGQPPAPALSEDGSILAATLATAFVLALALLAWPALARRLALPLRPGTDGAALAVLLTLLVVALLTWIFNPFACLLLIPALHLWLLAVGPWRRAEPQARALAYGAIALGALPPLLLAIAYARELGLGVGGLAESAVLALIGGQLGALDVLLWGVALGCLFAVLLLAPPPDPVAAPGIEDWPEIATRGPASYAGPGSLGGTESALRR
jgi:hypothetical protein